MTDDVSSVVENINSLESLGFDILNCSIKQEHKINVELTKKLSPSQSTT
jgi:4-hydroxy-3-methylbut-2-en-1-yl diphosphate synthase IspG/GcpE